MKYMGRLVAILLLLTVFFIRMASELLNNVVGINREFALLVLLFCTSLVFWLGSIIWAEECSESLLLFAATFGLFFISMEYFISYNLDLVAVLTGFVLFAVSLGRRGNSGGEQMRSTMSTYTVARANSTGVPVSVVRDYSPPSDEVEIEEDFIEAAVTKKAVKKTPALKDEAQVKFVASKRGKFYHEADSDWALKIKKENRKEFANKEEAWEAGYRAHKDIA